MARTRVCITIDTEFSIAGAFSDKTKQPVAEPLVWCNVDGRSEGLGFMLDTFRRYDIQATFFVDTQHRHYFKHDPMRPIAQQLHAAGHEVQLHAHPCWTNFQNSDWRNTPRAERISDDISQHSIEATVKLIDQGIDTFKEWGIPRPRAFRSGNLHHGDGLYQALAQTGITYSSNIGVAIHDSGNPDYRLFSGQHQRHGVKEYPVLSFSDWRIGPKQNIKSLTIAGSSFAETRRLLEKARSEGIPLVVVLTHPFEFVQKRDLAFTQTRPDRLTQGRLRKLCEFLQENSDRFDACGLASAADAIPAAQASENKLLKGRLWHTVPRMVAQVANDRIGKWKLAQQYGKAGRNALPEDVKTLQGR
ncbi:polysaccharide deacetylase family protein [Massilia litorea]|uniref:Polysaccharide deacetylase family protein n=1 Tax=Massilia litorea TaxID=2769491 RepID=A0A7L9U7V3_9BURK|nr:polysaccharide deacetylase family protein [Massilia litorea]QOL50937.1 polysaccharide deacetylase family protein [Massilia litorea]